MAEPSKVEQNEHNLTNEFGLKQCIFALQQLKYRIWKELEWVRREDFENTEETVNSIWLVDFSTTFSSHEQIAWHYR